MKRLLILTIASSCLFGDLAKAAQVLPSPISAQNSTLIAKKETIVKKTTVVKRTQPVRSQYDTFMKVAYTAYDKKDYNTALINFKRALASRPNDKYATKAIQNVEKRLAGK